MTLSVEEVSTVHYKCKCEAVSRHGVPCGFEWETDKIPLRCRKCKRYTWNKLPKLIAFNGKSQSLSQWAAELGISKYTLYGRLKAGWAMEDCMDPNLFQSGRKPNNP